MDEATLARVNGHLADAEILVERESLREQARQILFDAADRGDTRSAVQAELLLDRLKRI